MRFPSLHKLHAQKYKTSLPHRFRQCNGKPGRWVIFHIPFFAVSARGATCGRQPAPGFPKFQFTPLREGRHLRRRQTVRERKFQFTPLREGRQTYPGKSWGQRLFQFTPLREGRQGLVEGHRSDPHFNSRPCERGDRLQSCGRCVCQYFNSRPCERGDSAWRPSSA